jgi:ribose transport system ATP-binding protein
MDQAENFLIVNHMSKAFPGVIALDDVDLTVRKGEVHGLVGKNGAGKSTLIKIISGIYTSDQGKIFYDGNELSNLTPIEAHNRGIQVVPQEQQFQPHLNVSENMFVGSWLKGKLGFVDFPEMDRQTEAALAKLNINIPVSRLARDLTVMQRQLIAIAKAIFMNAKLIILDEPTPALTLAETKILFRFIRDLASQGISFIYISHYLNEVFEVCDCVSVMRDGHMVHTADVCTLSTSQLVEFMIGKAVDSTITRQVDPGNNVLQVTGLTSIGSFSDVSFSLAKGEILGITGLMGCGSFELAKSLFGLVPLDSGEIRVEEKLVKISNPENALKNGIALLPEERRSLGLIVNMAVDFNINLSNLQQLTNNAGFIDETKFSSVARKYVDMIGISTPSLIQEVKFLSGGNQQKVVVSRLMNTNPRILVMLDPTAGIDVEAKAEIHRLMDKLTQKGLSILLLSTDLDELLTLSDRVLVMHQGKIVSEYKGIEATKHNILMASEGIVNVSTK